MSKQTSPNEFGQEHHPIETMRPELTAVDLSCPNDRVYGGTTATRRIRLCVAGGGTSEELYNFGRAPLNRDLNADGARPLPVTDEAAYGGGTGTRFWNGLVRALRGHEGQVQMSNASRGNEVIRGESHVQMSYARNGNGVSTPSLNLSVPANGVTSTQMPKTSSSDRVTRSVKVTKKSKTGEGEGGEISAANFKDTAKIKDERLGLDVIGNETLVNQDDAPELTQDAPPPILEDCVKVPQFDSLNDSEIIEEYLNSLLETKSIDSEHNSFVSVQTHFEWSDSEDTFKDDYVILQCSFDTDTEHDLNTPRTYGRAPPISNFVADGARPLPFSGGDAYGGGTRMRSKQIGGDPQFKMSSITRGNVALTAEVQFPVHLPEELPKQKTTSQGNQIAEITKKRGGCFPWL